jgi:hypothetical protein
VASPGTRQASASGGRGGGGGGAVQTPGEPQGPWEQRGGHCTGVGRVGRGITAKSGVGGGDDEDEDDDDDDDNDDGILSVIGGMPRKPSSSSLYDPYRSEP